jgi:predicted aspartyl protease
MFSWTQQIIFPIFFFLAAHNSHQPLATHLSVHDTINVSKNLNTTENPGDPVVTSEPASSIIPFTRAGNLIVIKARIDSTEGNFILDTGAPGLILNTTYFRHLSDAEYNGEESGGITGGTIRANPADVPNLSFGPINYYKLNADRVNLGHIENSKGIKILGLLGMQLFKKFEMIIDYEKNEIYLHLIGKKEAKTYKSEMLTDTSKFSEFTIDIKDNKLLTFGKLAGKKLTFIIDTGAESNVLDSRLPDRIFEQVDITRRIMLSGSGSDKVEALYGDMKNVMIGDLQLSTIPVVITNLEKMCFSYDRCLDGMLGFDFLSMHKIGFNFVTRKMYIWK